MEINVRIWEYLCKAGKGQSGNSTLPLEFLSSQHIWRRVNDPEAIKNLVAGGLGVSIISKRAAGNFLREKRLLSFELPESANDRDLYLVCRREQAERSPVKDFVEFLTRFYANGPKN